MPIPDYQTLMLPVLELAAQRETRVPEAADIIADKLGLTEAEREEMGGNVSSTTGSTGPSST